MTLTYALTANDFVAYQLFAASQSARIRGKQWVGRILLGLGFGIASLYYFLVGNSIMTAYCATITVLFALFYPRYFIWRYRRHFRLSVAENYKGRIGETEHLELQQDGIHYRDKTGEGRINLAEIDAVNETSEYFFIQLNTGNALILPKRVIPDLSAFERCRREMQIPIRYFPNGAWIRPFN